jgi:hypothetical protein
MAITPTTQNNLKLPVYQCADKGLESALNTLARAIEAIRIPDVRLPTGAGTMEWDGKSVLIRPSERKTMSRLAPWSPVFEASSTPNSSLVSFRLGTINGVVPSNWSVKHPLTTLQPDEFKYVILTVTTESGAVTGATISLDTDPVTEEVIAKSIPPTQFKVVLGVLWQGGFAMTVDYNLQALATVSFTENRIPVGAGESPTDNWYVWQITPSN